MEAVEKKVVKKLCKNCKSYHRKNAKTGKCKLLASSRIQEGVQVVLRGEGPYKNRDNNWTCEKFVEVV